MENTFGQNIIPENEKERLENLKKYRILYTQTEPIFDQLAAMAATVFDMPIAMINFVDKDSVWTKAGKEAVPGISSERGTSLCSLAVLKDEPTVFEDTLKEPCLLTNPVIAGENGFRFYAAAPISSQEGFRIGVICIIDRKPRKFDKAHQETLQRIAHMIETEIARRLPE